MSTLATHTGYEPALLKAARMESTGRTPLWIMRQAGRVLPEYRKVREKHSLLDICRNPELAASVTLQPLERFDVDAAIVFADIVTPLVGVGIEVELVEKVGPVIDPPVRSRGDLERLRPLEPEQDVPYMLEALRLVRAELPDEKALIGFAGAPFTLATYLIEGGPSRNYAATKAMMYSQPDLWHGLMGRLSGMVKTYLLAQAAAGAQALQLFDSWVGWLSRRDYQEYVFPYTREILSAVKAAGAPVIHFATGSGGLNEVIRESGADVVGLDWRVPLDEAWASLGAVAVQGNLDPAVLLGPPEVVREQTRDVLQRAGGRPGHIFNLGHGILPQTPLDNVMHMIDCVREWDGAHAS
ncbi:MAG: uroporphyrinogen decarboxylase [Chloroflexota bacterium]|nr:uroporphyrinogen decarboxylase [Chloroflexota bacterium]MDE2884062.1 uroporphyrinogen decarboxylase [Chloroflexota bacterium]